MLHGLSLSTLISDLTSYSFLIAALSFLSPPEKLIEGDEWP